MDICRLMTEGLSIPLTAAYACTQLYSDSQLASMDDFVLHLAGSSDYELDQVTRTAVIEELMHLLPAVKKLHVVMAGEKQVAAPPATNKLTNSAYLNCCPQVDHLCNNCPKTL